MANAKVTRGGRQTANWKPWTTQRQRRRTSAHRRLGCQWRRKARPSRASPSHWAVTAALIARPLTEPKEARAAEGRRQVGVRGEQVLLVKKSIKINQNQSIIGPDQRRQPGFLPATTGACCIPPPSKRKPSRLCTQQSCCTPYGGLTPGAAWQNPQGSAPPQNAACIVKKSVARKTLRVSATCKRRLHCVGIYYMQAPPSSWLLFRRESDPDSQGLGPCHAAAREHGRAIIPCSLLG